MLQCFESMDLQAKRLFTGPKFTSQRRTAFSLVEVVIALGVCAFVLVAMLGLFQVGLKSGRESEEAVTASNLASRIIAMRAAAPTNDFANAPIPAQALKQAYGDAYGGQNKFVGFDGLLAAATSPYRISCKAGTNSQTGPYVSQIHLVLTWPPQVDETKAAGRYEVITYLPLF